MISGRVLDSTALTAYTKGGVYIAALLSVANRAAIVLAVPATCLADALSQVDTAGRAALERLLAVPVLVVDDLSADAAMAVGDRLRAAGQPGQLAAGHATLCGVRRSWPVVTTRRELLFEIDPRVVPESLP